VALWLVFQARLKKAAEASIGIREKSRGIYDLKIGRVGLKNDILCQARAATLAARRRFCDALAAADANWASKLKIWKGFSEPNFGGGPNLQNGP
jgi:hypothetical protein